MKNWKTGMRLGVASLTAFGVITTGAITIPQFATADLNTVTATTALNVRTGPSTNDRVIGVLMSGDQVQRRGDSVNGWTPITYQGQDAFVSSQYVTTGSGDVAGGGTATATDFVNLRSSDSTLSRVLTVVPNGATLSVTGAASGDWVPVSFQGLSGYVFSAYVKQNATATGPADAPQATRTSADAPTGDGPHTDQTGTATTAVNVRESNNTSSRVLTVLRQGQAIDVVGTQQGDWIPVVWNGQMAWVAAEFLTVSQTPAAAAPAPAAPQSSTSYTTTAVNLRTGPGLGYSVQRVLNTNTAVELTGTVQDGWSQVNDGGAMRWVSTTYLSDSPVNQAPATSGATQGPATPVYVAPSGTLNTGGSSGLDSMQPATKNIVMVIRANFPQITTMYGVRQDPYPDHPSGRAVDLMMPNGASDQVLGDQIANYLTTNADSLGIEYLIWRQRIWIRGSGQGWTWMADRGGVTANHYDHVHVTVD